MMGRISLVAHRGQPLSFPENSLEGFTHAVESGASYVETDIHLTADGIPVLSHDANLLKLTGKQIIVSDHNYEVIKDMPAGFKERFDDQFEHCRVATLNQFVDLMKKWPNVTCFIELKAAALNYFGPKAVDIIVEALHDIQSQCVLISFEYDALSYAKSKYDLPIGWVLPEWSEENRNKAKELSPRYLFVDGDICPEDKTDVWTGSWEWAVYTVNKAEGVEHFAGLGIELIETDRYSELEKESDIVEVSNDF